jgi:hypothetical protein
MAPGFKEPNARNALKSCPFLRPAASKLPFKLAVKSFPIFRSACLALSFTCDAQKISFGLNLNVLGVNPWKINADNVITVLAVCLHPGSLVINRILRLMAREKSTE